MVWFGSGFGFDGGGKKKIPKGGGGCGLREPLVLKKDNKNYYDQIRDGRKRNAKCQMPNVKCQMSNARCEDAKMQKMRDAVGCCRRTRKKVECD